MNLHISVSTAALLSIASSILAEAPEPKFRAVTIDPRVQIGYGVAIGDVDGDKRPDILMADKKQFVWYRNPGPEKMDGPWERFLLAENLTSKDNVCLAAQDIDGDGKCEVAVGAEWNPGDTEKSGAVFYLIPPDDRTQPWEAVKLHAEPTVHRMRWFKDGERWKLIVLPLHGRGNRNGEGAPVQMLMYDPPQDRRGEWKTSVVDASLHMTHNFEIGPDNTILVAGKEGVAMLKRAGDKWDRSWFVQQSAAGGATAPSATAGENAEFQGAGEVRFCRAGTGTMRVATVEPMHGNAAVVYLPTPESGPGAGGRVVLTGEMSEGHALGCADFLGTGEDQIAVGWRGSPQKPRPVGIKLFTPADAKGGKWRESAIDDNEMAAEDLQVTDLNGDGKPDIVASGRSTKNLKIYLNETVPAVAGK